SPVAGLVAALGMLDLDHVSAERGEDLRAIRSGEGGRDVHDADSGEGEERAGHRGANVRERRRPADDAGARPGGVAAGRPEGRAPCRIAASSSGADDANKVSAPRPVFGERRRKELPLKRTLLLVFLAALAVPGVASAARGVVVKVDRGTNTVAVARAHGRVSLLHVGSTARIHVGSRLEFSARTSNGTLAATRVRVLGRAPRTHVRGTV